MLKKESLSCFAFIFLLLNCIRLYAQCPPPPSPPTATYCNGQYAEIKISDPDPLTKYHWYELVGSNYLDRGYGQEGSGRYYVSTGTVSGPVPITYYYSKETDSGVGPTYRAPAGGSSQVTNIAPYSMPFSSTVDFKLNAVTVVVKMNSNTSVYGFQIVHNDGTTETFSNWFTGTTADFISLGNNLYQVDIPVTNISIKKGTGQSLEFRSVANAGQNVAVDGIYWWNGTEYNGAGYLSNSINLTDPEQSVSAVVRSPLIMDWQITTLCDKVGVTATLASSCCLPVGSNFNVSSSSYITFPATLTAIGTDVSTAGFFYYWYDENNVLLGSGQDKKTQSITKPGFYTVKVVRKVADLNSFSCVGKKIIEVENKSIYTFADTTICIGQPFSLTASGAEGNYKWASTSAAANAAITTKNVQTTTVNLTSPGTYKFIVSGDVKLNNIAYDGKFEKYDDRTNFNIKSYPSSFETTYGNTTSNPVGAYIVNNNEFRVDNKIIAYSSNSFHCTDPSYNQKTDPISGDVVSRGNIYYADANSSGPEAAYSEIYGAAHYLWQLSNQPVKVNTDYEFSMDVSNWNAGAAPPDIMLLVNGKALPLFVGGVQVSTATQLYYTYSGPDCQWKTLIGKWNSGSNTSATITVSEVSKINQGHEFAMDDITFSSGRGTQYDTVNVTVQDCFTISAKADSASVCAGNLVNLAAITNGFIQKWEDGTGTTVGITPNIKAYPATNTVYKVTAMFPVINLFPNSDFSNDNSGIESATGSLTYKPYGSEPNTGEYSIVFGNESWLYNTYLNGGDHSSGNGTFLLAKVNSNTQPIILRKTISVTAGQSYGVSFFTANYTIYPTNDGPASVSIALNGTPVAGTNLSNNTKNWAGTQYLWTATTSGTVTIDLISPNEPKSKVIALDDVKIGQLGLTKVANVAVSARDCGSLIPRSDTLTCIGGTVKLSAVTNGFITQWSPTADLNDPSSPTPTAGISATTKFKVEAQFPIQRYFTNSNFQDGDLGFTSDLAKSGMQSPQDNQYYVGNGNETFLNYPFVKPTVDHTTGNGTGLYLIAKTKTGADRQIFSQSIAVTSGNSYAISFWTTDMHQQFNNSAPLSFQVKVGGNVVKTVTYTQDRIWRKTEYSWTATSNGNTIVEIVSPKEITGDRERAFGLDDVTLAQLGNKKEAFVNVTAKDCFILSAKVNGACIGDSVEIEATTNGLFTGWSHDNGTPFVLKEINKAFSLKTWVHPKATTIYRATASMQIGNLITNGDFEAGNTGFTSDYATPLTTSSQYSVDKDPYVVLNGASWTFHKFDHTSGKGKMYLSDGGSNPAQAVYKTTINVISGKKYAFSAWLANIHSEFLKAIPDTNQFKTTNLAFFIDGQPNNSIKLPLDTAWHQYYATWLSNKTGSITIEIRDRETAQGGNDFALDDIVFAPFSTDKFVTISVPACVVCNQPSSVDLKETKILATKCEGAKLDLTGEFKNAGKTIANSGQYFSWYKEGTAQSAITYTKISPNPTGTGIIQVLNNTFNSLALTDSGKWILRVEDGNSGEPTCFIEDTVTVVVNPIPVSPTVLDTSVCIGSTNNKVLAKTTASGDTLKWYNAAGTGTIVDPNPINVTTASVQTFQVSQVRSAVNGSCEGPKVTVSFTVKARPAKPTITPDKNPICAGVGLKLTATSTTSAATFTWIKPTGSNAAPVLGVMSTTNAAISEAGWYNVTATDAGCTDSTNIKVIVNAKPIKATIGISPNKTKFCEGEAHTLIASSTASSSFAWTGDGTGTTNPLAGKTTAGAFRYIVTPTLNGCPGDSGSVVITVDPKPFPAAVLDIASACVKDQIKTTATPVPAGSPGTGSWKIESSTTTGYGLTSLTDPQTIVTIPSIPVNGDKIVATWTVKNGVCKDTSKTMTITFNAVANPLVGLTAGGSVCEGANVTFKSNGNNTGTAGFTYTLYNKDKTVARPAQSSTDFVFSNVTTDLEYYVSLTSTSTCRAKDTANSSIVKVAVIKNPVALITVPSVSPKLISTTGTSIAANLPVTGYTGLWSLPILGQQGTIKVKAGLASGDSLVGLNLTEEDGAGKGTTKVAWTVKETTGTCPDSVVTITIIRRKLTPPDAGKDTTLCVSSLPKVFKGNGNNTILVIENYKWTDLNSPTVATISNNDFTLPANTPEGIYKFEFSIQNSVSGTNLRDTVTIKVDGLTSTPTLDPALTGTSSSSPYLICSAVQDLKGVKTTQSLNVKNWWQKVSGTGTIPVLDSSTATTTSPEVQNMTGIAGAVQAKFYYKNGVCPSKSVDLFLKKVGDVTAADVAITGKSGPGSKEYLTNKDSLYQKLPLKAIADTLCMGGNYTLSPRKTILGEKGNWTKISGTNITLGATPTIADQPLIITGTGKSVFKWEVQGPVLGCNPNDITITLVVHDIPSGAILSGYDSHCEGTDSLYKVIPLPNPSLPVTYTWDAGANPGAFRTGAQKGESTTYRMYSDAAGTTKQGTISVTPSNACGTGTILPKVVGILLAPRVLSPSSPADKIVGRTRFCGSRSDVSYILTGHPDVETFSWSWDNILPIKTTNSTTDSAVITQSLHWIPDLDKIYTLRVSLTNHCSDSAQKNGILPVVKTNQDTVVAPVDVRVKLKATPQFCMPDQAVPFDADSIQAYKGLKRTYEFSVVSGVSTTTVQTGTSDKYLAPVGLLKDGDKVIVKIIPDASPKQCVTYPVLAFSDEIVMEGFGYPPSDIIPLTPVEICDDEPGIVLSVKTEKTSKLSPWHNDIKWFKSGTYLPQFDGLFTLPPLKSFEDSGKYSVVVGSNLLGCAPHVSTTANPVAVQIFERPDALVLADPYPVPYTEGVNIYHMPVVVTKPNKDVLTKSEYSPTTWLEDPHNVTTLLVPEKEDKQVTYILTLETGSATKKCPRQIPVNVIYYLPIDIPNAFSPNGDGLNDEWVIKGLGKYPNSKVKVYNRWGSSMYVDNDGYKAVWNGTHNGAPLPAGTYYYIIELKGSSDNTDQSKTGALTIIR